MLTDMFEKYLSILECQKENSLDFYFLAKLQYRHLVNIPFQNVEYFRKGEKWIDLYDPQSLIEPVLKKQGGLCFHLNYSFYSLLKYLGFKCHLISGFMKKSDFDHMAIVVYLDLPYLIDVGYGEYFLTQPVPIIDDWIHHERSGAYWIRKEQERYVLRKNKRTRWLHQYSFELKPRQLRDFHQSFIDHLEGSSGFKDNVIFSKWTEHGNFIRLFNQWATIYSSENKLRVDLSSIEFEMFLRGKEHAKQDPWASSSKEMID